MRGKRLKRDAIPGSLNCSSGKHDPHIVVRCAYIVTSCNLILGVDDQLDERNIKVDEYYYAVITKTTLCCQPLMTTGVLKYRLSVYINIQIAQQLRKTSNNQMYNC